MVLNERKKLVIEPYERAAPEVGRWLWAVQETRLRTLEALAGLSPEALDWAPPEGQSSIGALLYHLAAIEADWLYVEALEEPFPPAVEALFPHPVRDDQGRLTQVRRESLEAHLARLETVRGLLLAGYQGMDRAEFQRVRSFEPYDVTPEYILHHFMQHEAEHRGQIGSLIERFKSD